MKYVGIILICSGIAMIMYGVYGIGKDHGTFTVVMEMNTDSVYIRDLEQENERLTREVDSLLYGNDAETTCNL